LTWSELSHDEFHGQEEQLTGTETSSVCLMMHDCEAAASERAVRVQCDIMKSRHNQLKSIQSGPAQMRSIVALNGGTTAASPPQEHISRRLEDIDNDIFLLGPEESNDENPVLHNPCDQQQQQADDSSDTGDETVMPALPPM
jgi:hypothetical protein